MGIGGALTLGTVTPAGGNTCMLVANESSTVAFKDIKRVLIVLGATKISSLIFLANEHSSSPM